MIIESQAVGPFFKNGFVVGCEKTRQAVLIDPGDEVESLLAFATHPTAVICGNDVLAMGAVLECHAQGIAVPEAVSVTGFDDMEAASILVPALTTVRVPMRELGYAAAQQILAHIGGKAGARVTELAVDLIVRGTTAPPRAGRR